MGEVLQVYMSYYYNDRLILFSYYLLRDLKVVIRNTVLFGYFSGDSNAKLFLLQKKRLDFKLKFIINNCFTSPGFKGLNSQFNFPSQTQIAIRFYTLFSKCSNLLQANITEKGFVFCIKNFAYLLIAKSKLSGYMVTISNTFKFCYHTYNK